MSGHVTLLIGGARAGKSRIAQSIAAAAGEGVAFVATATAGDDEMAERIARHKADRPANWITVEEPLHPAARLAGMRTNAIILDCITLWVSNRLLASVERDEHGESDRLTRDLIADISGFVDAARAAAGGTIIVTNEVGLAFTEFTRTTISGT